MQWQFSTGKHLLGMFSEKHRHFASYFSKEPEEFTVIGVRHFSADLTFDATLDLSICFLKILSG